MLFFGFASVGRCFAQTLRRIYDSPRNDEKKERFYFWQKQKVAKTFARIFDLILSLDSCFARIYNRSNGGSALRCLWVKQAK